MKFSKKIVTFIIFANIVFTVVMCYLHLITSAVPDSLVIAWFSFTTVELGGLAGIKIAEARNEYMGGE